MQVTVEKVGSLARKLKIIIPEEQVGREMDSAYRKLQSEVALKGFRKGKVPRKILEKHYAPKVKEEVYSKLVQETYFDAVKEARLDPIVHPVISKETIDPEGRFLYEAEVDIRPIIEMQGYKGLSIEMPAVSVTEEEVDNTVEMLRKQMAPLRTVDGRGIEIGDVVIIDYQGKENGVPMPQIKGEHYSVDVGTGRNGKEFEEQLLGLKAGEKAEKVVEFPPNFASPMLAGKRVEFTIFVRNIKERVLPPLDEEFAKDVGKGFNTLTDLRRHVRQEVEKKKKEAQEGDLTDKIMLKLIDANGRFELPQRLVTFEINELIKNFESTLERQGHTLESAGLNRTKLFEQYREVAEKRVRGDFILKDIANKEDIKLADQEIESGFKRIAVQYGMSVDEVKEHFKGRDNLLPFLGEIFNEKVLSFLRANTIVTYVLALNEVTSEQGESTGEGQ